MCVYGTYTGHTSDFRQWPFFNMHLQAPKIPLTALPFDNSQSLHPRLPKYLLLLHPPLSFPNPHSIITFKNNYTLPGILKPSNFHWCSCVNEGPSRCTHCVWFLKMKNKTHCIIIVNVLFLWWQLNPPTVYAWLMSVGVIAIYNMHPIPLFLLCYS